MGASQVPTSWAVEGAEGRAGGLSEAVPVEFEAEPLPLVLPPVLPPLELPLELPPPELPPIELPDVEPEAAGMVEPLPSELSSSQAHRAAKASRANPIFIAFLSGAFMAGFLSVGGALRAFFCSRSVVPGGGEIYCRGGKKFRAGRFPVRAAINGAGAG